MGSSGIESIIYANSWEKISEIMAVLDIDAMSYECDCRFNSEVQGIISKGLKLELNLLRMRFRFLPAIFDPCNGECWKFREDIKQHLTRMNQDSQIPLDFRLATLVLFQAKYSGYFDNDVVVSMLESYVLSMCLLQKSKSYLKMLDVSIAALVVSISSLKERCKHYQDVTINKTRLLYQIIHLACGALTHLEGESQEKNYVFGMKVCQYYMLKRMDLFSKKHQEQSLSLVY